jgi:transcriptional regulator with XRE-family HTH domain
VPVKKVHTLKSIYRPENLAFLATLRGLREEAGLTQAELAERLGHTQNYVTAAERGLTRLDCLQVHDWCQACGASLTGWATRVEALLGTGKRPGRKRRSTT